MSETAVSYQYIRVEREARVGLVRLHRPEVRNALSPDLLRELADALHALDADDTIGCLLLTGGDGVFAAGADIRGMAEMSAIDMLAADWMERWASIRRIRKPLVAAINGYALGGGCELAMMCDILIAGENATFGQPEVNLGVIPGAGGTQRLTRAVGKVRAMELILTGRSFSAQEALVMGLINRVTPPEATLTEAMAMAKTIAEKPALAVRLAKESILKSLETPLEEGLDAERRLFALLFASSDQKEGMRAFLEKRPAVW
jgi:enoyl-CoA hydratase